MSIRSFGRLFVLLAVAGFARADEPDLSIADFETPGLFRPTSEMVRVDAVEGHEGKALRFSFDGNAKSAFAASSLRGNEAWDNADGFSFWVKGDGSKALGGLQFIYDDDYAVRYDLAFPIDSEEWRKVVVRWDDLVPILPGENSRPLSQVGPNRPSKLSALWVGKWWYWRDYPACSFEIDDLRLEPSIPREPAPGPEGSPLARVAKKLRAGEPITIVTMGDSLTDARHWANRETNWPRLLADRIEREFGSKVSIVNPAIGGTQLRQGMVLIPRWRAEAPTPDLVTVCFGYNDWDAGMRGEQFRETYVDAVRRIRQASGGESDVLLLTTAPAATRWTEMAELAQACRDAASGSNAGLADIESALHAAGRDDRERLYVDDRVHLGPPGHEVVAETILSELRKAVGEPNSDAR